MPAVVSPPSASRPDPKTIPSKPRAQPSSRKVRVVRRRGRANGHFESDDEFEREVGTDSESDNDDHSTVDSVTDSDTEPASEDVLSNGHSHILTPNTTQSSGDASLNHSASKPLVGDPSFFGTAGNWSEMVAEETVNGPADLPVIEFADFDGHSMDRKPQTVPTARKTTKPSKRAPVKRAVPAPASDHSPRPQSTPLETGDRDELSEDPPLASTSQQPSRGAFVRRPPGQSARQAYQQRLEADPSYVPSVGEFWAHDDRLLDKDLRSLSGWWRGRWQGRGRGRGGFDRGFMRGRGRGGFLGPDSGHRIPQQDGSDPKEGEKVDADAPPIDQPWTHDGFEEMKRRDEKRRALQQQQARPVRGFGLFRGRGGFSPRGRDGFGRGGFTPPATAVRTGSPVAPPSAVGRTWYAMKPERVWTKQHEAFLYFDSALKPRPGHGPGYRVKLSDGGVHVVRGPPKSGQPASQASAEVSSAHAASSEDGDRAYVVRVPKSADKKQAAEPVVTVAEPVTTVEEPPIEDVFTVRPGLVPRVSILESQPPAPAANDHDHGLPLAPPSAGPSTQPDEPSSSSPPAPPVSPKKITSPLLNQLMQDAAEQQANQSSQAVPTGVVWEQQENTAPALFQAEGEPSNRRSLPAVPPLQTVFSPPPQPSPPYGSPYGYGSPLPPGIVVNQHGMPYEVATGRAVYLQAPPTMYTPRPLAHGMMTPPGLPFVPGHMHHHSASSPDFLAPPRTPINGFIDPATGGPIFSFPRQNSRIEIRPPSAQVDGKSSTKSFRRPSGLRTSAAPFEPSRPASPTNLSYFPDAPGSTTEESYPMPEAEHNGEAAQPMQEQPIGPHSMMPYSPYQQQYYYPEQYGYSQYYDMSQTPQYEMYPGDPHAHPQAVYY
ncbi:hypothetical protein BV22DRAFT_1068315 [Leucogyrophana mollusca]|uniref:Uncharacterized protein n=1 Tax=Leucogyrophana mollusca TaxID=85980 RepID=A0ACB8BD75_9AGAM|nr:hypothetical protein BV22DRAFT_1068315 [Leucogyrophana mollusca]